MANTYSDQMGRTVDIGTHPARIISLVPSITEFLFDIGLGHRIVGVTKFCVHPPTARKEKVIIGGTKNFRLDEIDRLAPDLIIGNKEENYIEGIETLAERFPVWMSDINNLEEAYVMMRTIGSMTGKQEEANHVIQKVERSFSHFEQFEPLKVIYLIWHKPMMAAGKNTFIDAMLSRLGLKNVISKSRYPEISKEELVGLKPELILLSSEPFPFDSKHKAEYTMTFKDSRIHLVDGEMFSWYGSRLVKSANYFHQLRTQWS